MKITMTGFAKQQIRETIKCNTRRLLCYCVVLLKDG